MRRVRSGPRAFGVGADICQYRALFFAARFTVLFRPVATVYDLLPNMQRRTLYEKP